LLRVRAKPIGDYLGSGDGIGTLMPRAADLLALRRALDSALAERLPRSISIANYKQGVVVFLADSGTAGARLRLLEPRITEILSNCGFEVTGIRVVVQPRRRTTSQWPEQKGLFLSGAAGDALRRAAQSLSPGPLKDNVMTLSRRVRPPTEGRHSAPGPSQDDGDLLEGEQGENG
jgi:hypothetical protein